MSFDGEKESQEEVRHSSENDNSGDDSDSEGQKTDPSYEGN